ncbi:hypothetical protein [Prauserella muralis]|uniref:hypothetical protein n=1 Tax=Prauserella muralis TaxID=588067 RepID=UPI00147511CF|nr:hypothetical protein [Prauserella muralis]
MPDRPPSKGRAAASIAANGAFIGVYAVLLVLLALNQPALAVVLLLAGILWVLVMRRRQ